MNYFWNKKNEVLNGWTCAVEIYILHPVSVFFAPIFGRADSS